MQISKMQINPTIKYYEIWQNILKFCDNQDGEIYSKDCKDFATHVYLNDLEYVKKNFKHITEKKYKNFCFRVAASFSSDPQIIDKLIIVFKIDHKIQSEYLLFACSYNKNVDIIKHFIHVLKIEPMKVMDELKRNCLIIACGTNSNINIIKFLIEDVKININYKDEFGVNCLMYACKYSKNVSIIEYLIENQKMCPLEKNNIREDCLFSAISSNKNSCVIKYLFDVINKKLKKSYEKYFEINNKIYEGMLIDIQLLNLINLSLHIPSYQQFNKLLNYSVKVNNCNIVNYVLQNVNFLMINKKNQQKMSIHIFEISFDKFKLLVNEFKCLIPDNEIRNLLLGDNTLNHTHGFFSLDSKSVDQLKQIDEKKNYLINAYTEQNEKLFKHNDKYYFGNKKIVYSSMDLFKGIDEILLKTDDDNLIELFINVSEYLMNLYVHTSHGHWFDIQIVSPNEFLDFLNLIDKYPTNVLSINKLEKQIIWYIMYHSISIEQSTKLMLDKYKLNRLYLYLQQSSKSQKVT